MLFVLLQRGCSDGAEDATRMLPENIFTFIDVILISSEQNMDDLD